MQKLQERGPFLSKDYLSLEVNNNNKFNCEYGVRRYWKEIHPAVGGGGGGGKMNRKRSIELSLNYTNNNEKQWKTTLTNSTFPNVKLKQNQNDINSSIEIQPT